MADNRSALLPEPSIPPITWNGRAVTPSYITDLFARNWKLARWRTANIKRALEFRRLALRVQVDKALMKDHPELGWVVSVMSERTTLEREQIARVVAALPRLNRESLGDLDRDDRYAEEYERYMQDWTEQNVPRKEFGVKGVEDGEYGVVILPTELDMDGEPDFYDRLDERAYKALDADKRGDYKKIAGDTKGRYGKHDASGNLLPSSKWGTNKAGQAYDEAKKSGKSDTWNAEQKKLHDAHDKARDRYLLKQDAVNVRIIPALDCVAVWKRGSGKNRFELAGLIERSLISIEEAFEAEYGWLGLGNRLMTPRGFEESRSSNLTDEYYLYTAYLTSKDKDKCEHPLIISCLGMKGGGGVGTWSISPTYSSGTVGDKNSVTVIDLYKTHGLTGPFWGYFGGMATGDDSPHHRFQPWMFPFIDQVMAIEGTTTQARIAVSLNATTGYSYKPDAALGDVDDETIIETGINGKRRLRPPVLAKPGQIVTNAGDITPQMTASVSPDLWRQLSDEKASLLQNTSTERPSQASGNALVQAETIASVNQVQVRDGVAAATKFAAERAAMIFNALAVKRQVFWPLATTKKPAIGPEGKDRPGRTVSRFDPDWLGDEVNFSLTASYPSEENLARIDLESKLQAMGLASFKDVQDARGKEDWFEVLIEIAKDRIRNMPESMALLDQRVAEITGNRKLLKILRLKAAQQMVDGGVPGMAAGMPAAMLNRGPQPPQGSPPPGGGSPPPGAGAPAGVGTASDSRGGIQQGQMNTARAQQQVQAAVQGAPGQAA